jgi:4-amino-4-deoxy-L-arabinose transferase-like glycosyltransferase
MDATSFLRPAGATPRWWSHALLLALALAALLTLGWLPLVDEDEGEYAEVAAEMARSGDFLAPTLNGQPFYEKPILLFWLQAPLVQAFGPEEWAFRLPSLLASCAWIVAMGLWWRRRHGEAEALTAVWLAATSLGVALVGRAATMDALISLLLALTLFDLWSWLEYDRRALLRRAAVWAGLGMLAKGPVALVIPASVVLTFLVCTPAYRGRWRGLLDPWAWTLLLVVCLPWYLWYGVHTEGAFLRYFLLRENVGRLGGSLQGHSGGWGYYVVVLPVLLLPHTAVLVPLARRLAAAWRTPCERFLLLWFALVLLIFTLAGTKLPHYLLYGCTPIFLLAARARPGLSGTLRGLALLLPVLGLALPALASHFAQHDSNPYIREMLARGPEVFDPTYWLRAGSWLVLTLGGLALARNADRRSRSELRAASQSSGGASGTDLRSRESVVIPHLAASGLVSVLGASLVLLPALSALQQDPVRAAGRYAAALHTPVVSDNRMPSFSVYLGRPTEARPVRRDDIAFGRLDHPDRLGRRHEVLFAQGGVRVVRVLEP